MNEFYAGAIIGKSYIMNVLLRADADLLEVVEQLRLLRLQQLLELQTQRHDALLVRRQRVQSEEIARVQLTEDEIQRHRVVVDVAEGRDCKHSIHGSVTPVITRLLRTHSAPDSRFNCDTINNTRTGNARAVISCDTDAKNSQTYRTWRSRGRE